MSYSANEVQMLAQKAARGAGAHPAQAAHFGRALVCHLAAGRAVSDLREALALLPDGPIQTLPFAPQQTPLGASYKEANAQTRAPARVSLPAEVHAQLSELAQNTYVPASEASRAAGAGAGLTDND